MVGVRLKGGMGNQMFQYAFGRQLARQLGTPLRLDASHLLFRNRPEGFVYRNYDLDVFRVAPAFLVSPALLAPVYNLRVARLSRLLQKTVTWPFAVVREPHFHFAPEILATARAGVIYNGWWQSPRYFAGVEAEVRRAFRFRDGVLPASAELLARITGSNAVCLNVRRTDFLKDATLNVTDLAYFQRAADLLGAELSEPRFFVFSDDVDWCRENIRLDYPMEVVGHEHKGRKFGNYLQLMRRCRHFIIPNSSFAWWAAWLNDAPDKRVIAPTRWFSDPQYDTSDLLPASWTRI